MESSGFIDVVTLPADGSYSLLVNPQDYAVGSLTLTLYDVPADFTATIQPGGAPVSVVTTAPGQDARLTFSGIAGQRVSVRGTNGAWTAITGCDALASIRKADNGLLGLERCMESSGLIDSVTLPADGNYSVWVNPAEHSVGSVTLTLEVAP
jgi:hypothetical protein